MSILAEFNSTIHDVQMQACKFWELEPTEFQIHDEKSVTLSPDLLLREVYDMKGGLNKISVELVNKYTS